MNKFKFTTKELIFKRDVYKFGKKKKPYYQSYGGVKRSVCP